jgi:dTDP-4-dehydrorhamnose 3,5-epimerase
VKVADTKIPEVKIVEPKVFGDDRGFFFESWNACDFAVAGIDASFVQDNHSRSAKGVLRGLHYQLEVPQGKLMRVVAGSIYDVAVDIRRSSQTYGQWVGVILSADNKLQMWVPQGFAHGFLSLEDGTELLYKCTDFYSVAAERSILWNDPSIGVLWPLEGIGAPQLSQRDAKAGLLDPAQVFP